MKTYEIVYEDDHTHTQYLIVLEEIRAVRLKPYTQKNGDNNVPVIGKSELQIWWKPSINQLDWRFVLPDKYAHQVYEDLRIILNKTEPVPV